MASTAPITSRRALLGGIAAVSAIAAAGAIPAAAAPAGNRHAGWMVERNAAYDHANASGLSDDECLARTDRLCVLESRIFDTPARSLEEAVVKVQLAAALSREGCTLDAESATDLFEEIDKWLALPAVRPA